jgi:hypothetical protein
MSKLVIQKIPWVWQPIFMDMVTGLGLFLIGEEATLPFILIGKKYI